MTKKLIEAQDLHAHWMGEPAYAKAHSALQAEFELASAIIAARSAAGLTQAGLAKRMNTTQTAIARLESGRARPSTLTLSRLALATGHRLQISFEPVAKRRSAGNRQKSA
jgi:ribosome-binding protein aMBF1 (putative translation factor)